MREHQAEQPPKQNSVDWEQLETEYISDEDKFLTEVDHLLRVGRLPDGSYDTWALDEQFKNMLSATKEAAMPYAVTRTEHIYQETSERDERGEKVGAYMWLGKTAVENALSGQRYHRHPEALKRVGIEVDEARDSINLRPGVTKVFISPRMTRADASLKDAKAEHLADDDAVRTSESKVDENGNRKRVMEALLVRDIPLDAWIEFLDDKDNIFGKSIKVRDDGSATSVMEVHRELEIDSDKLKNGVIDIVEAVTPYIKDPDIRTGVESQLARFHGSQEEMHAKAMNIAKRWQDFEIDLAESLQSERATPGIRNFINSMQTRWGDADLRVILEHQLADAQYEMSRKLAAILEKAKQNLLWTRAGVVTGNEKVIEQLDPETARVLRRDEMFIQVAADNGKYEEVQALEAQTNRVIASYNVKVGGGCPGETDTDFKDGDSSDGSFGTAEAKSWSSSSQESRIGKKSKGKCVVESCPTRPGKVMVGGCGVCLERCQTLFDAGKDPTKMRSAGKRAGQSITASIATKVNKAPEVPKPKQRETRNHEFALAA